MLRIKNNLKMIRKLSYSCAIGLVFLSARINAQEAEPQLNCTQTLRTARGIYDQGRLHELPTWLNGCLTKTEDNGGFSETERIEAYKILTLSYIYLEEPAEADKAMVSLLHTDPFFQIDEVVDPVEFKNLYRKFRTNPVYRIGVKFGANTNHINVISNYYLWAASKGKGEYSSSIGTQFGLVFEKDLTDRIVINPEVFYSSYSFNYTNNYALSTESSDPEEKTGSLEHLISQTRLQANILVQYKLKEPENIADKFIPFIAVGPTIGYLATSEFSGSTNVDEEVTGSPFDTKDNYKPLAFALTAMAGAKLKVGGFYITGDVRFQYGFLNIANKDKRLRWEGDAEQLLDYGYIDNDYSLSQSMFNLGIIFPRFNPKKLIR
jgi:hypothetical protein